MGTYYIDVRFGECVVKRHYDYLFMAIYKFRILLLLLLLKHTAPNTSNG